MAVVTLNASTFVQVADGADAVLVQFRTTSARRVTARTGSGKCDARRKRLD